METGLADFTFVQIGGETLAALSTDREDDELCNGVKDQPNQHAQVKGDGWRLRSEGATTPDFVIRLQYYPHELTPMLY